MCVAYGKKFSSRFQERMESCRFWSFICLDKGAKLPPKRKYYIFQAQMDLILR